MSHSKKAEMHLEHGHQLRPRSLQ